jgi:hypothetical protein
VSFAMMFAVYAAAATYMKSLAQLLTDRRVALAKRLRRQVPAGATNANGTGGA